MNATDDRKTGTFGEHESRPKYLKSTEIKLRKRQYKARIAGLDFTYELAGQLVSQPLPDAKKICFMFFKLGLKDDKGENVVLRRKFAGTNLTKKVSGKIVPTVFGEALMAITGLSIAQLREKKPEEIVGSYCFVIAHTPDDAKYPNIESILPYEEVPA